MDVVLPPKYYLDHFREFLDFLRERSGALLSPEHREFLRKFSALSEDAQCVFVRMSNRKGNLFFREELSYPEITDSEAAIAELIENSFAGKIEFHHWTELLNFLSKPELAALLRAENVVFLKSSSKSELIEIAKAQLQFAAFEKSDLAAKLIVQGQTEILTYLSFLYFGKIQRNLILYTLRDLGIRKTNTTRQDYRSRFESLDEAQVHFFYARLSDHLKQQDWSWEQTPPRNWPTPVDTHTKNLRAEALLQRGQELETAGEPHTALEFFEMADSAAARERRIRLLLRMGQKDLALQALEEILENPNSDAELLFAEDFLQRKFEKKRTSRLTDILREARDIGIDEAHFRRPEQGVLEHFQSQGLEAHFSENFLWNALFATLFWKELFQSTRADIFNPFERRSTARMGIEFYEKNKISLEKTLTDILQPRQAITKILKIIAAHYGELNDIFQWYPDIGRLLTSFLKNSNPESVVQVLRGMAQDFDSRRTGFPDLFVIREGQTHFIEIKAEGDQLKSHQLRQIHLLQKAGFPVEVLKVKWVLNPAQSYVVVDVETTGGSGKFHRVTEVAAVKVQNGKIVDQFQSLINPGRPIPFFITKLTGITNEMVADAPKFSEIADAFADFCEGSIFAAHNVRFDYGFIQSEFRRLEKDFVRPVYCTVANMRKHFPKLESYKLSRLSEAFGITLENHHRALDDAKAAAELLLKIQEKRALTELVLEDADSSPENTAVEQEPT